MHERDRLMLYLCGPFRSHRARGTVVGRVVRLAFPLSVSHTDSLVAISYVDIQWMVFTDSTQPLPPGRRLRQPTCLLIRIQNLPRSVRLGPVAAFGVGGSVRSLCIARMDIFAFLPKSAESAQGGWRLCPDG